MTQCVYFGGDGHDCKRCYEEINIPEFTIRFRKQNITVEKVKAYDYNMAIYDALARIHSIHNMTKISDMDITTEQTK